MLSACATPPPTGPDAPGVAPPAGEHGPTRRLMAIGNLPIATISAARLWFAPGRLSTTIWCGHVPASPAAIVRAMRSGDPPGGSGTTKRTGRLGKSCAATKAG